MALKVHKVYLPLAALYGLAVRVRNRLFDRGVLRSRAFPVPVVCVGNLTVGGTGKTPLIEYLVRLLGPSPQVAVLSRGYKRRSKGFLMAAQDTPVEQIGDEPWQMKQKFPSLTVAVDADRCHGIEELQKRCPGLRAVLLDDAFQHRYVKPGLSLLLMDYARPVFSDHLLPAGFLREPREGQKRADVALVTKCPPYLPPSEAEAFCRRLCLLPRQKLFFTTLGYGSLRPLFAKDAEARPLESLQGKSLLLLTGIASPQPLHDELARYARVVPLSFPDHHNFSPADMQRLGRLFRTAPEQPELVITTEKDAARLVCRTDYPTELKQKTFVLPVEVRFLYEKEQAFHQILTDYVDQNQ